MTTRSGGGSASASASASVRVSPENPILKALLAEEHLIDGKTLEKVWGYDLLKLHTNIEKDLLRTGYYSYVVPISDIVFRNLFKLHSGMQNAVLEHDIVDGCGRLFYDVERWKDEEINTPRDFAILSQYLQKVITDEFAHKLEQFANAIRTADAVGARAIAYAITALLEFRRGDRERMITILDTLMSTFSPDVLKRR